MSSIKLAEIQKQGKRVNYIFDFDSDLAQYFSGKPFSIEYAEDISSVPLAVLSIPFVANVLPIIWITDSELVIDELDEAFYNCIPNLKKGYETMFPETKFLGKITVGKIVKCDMPSESGKCAMFFSGGLDSVHTFISHVEEKPALLSIWGSDIKYDNAEGWELVHKPIAETSQKYNLPDVVIHSSFREFDNEGELSRAFSKQLKDGWWHGVKHGIALLGHVAPYAYLHRISTMYIASSNCPKDGAVRCASNPLTDNQVRFADCKVVHDGFECSRQDKTHNIVSYCKSNDVTFPLHVCWLSQKGSNCCRCEKCYRTMVALIAGGGEPENYGFEGAIQYFSMLHSTIVLHKNDDVIPKHWPHIQDALLRNKAMVKNTRYWKYIKWILKVDFHRPETIKMPISYRFRNFCVGCLRKVKRIMIKAKERL